jgi:hypothetical protein
MFVRKSFKRVLKRHVVYLIEQAAFHDDQAHSNAAQRLQNILSIISNLNFSLKVNNLDFYADIFRFFYFERESWPVEVSSKNFKLLFQLKKLQRRLDFAEVKRNLLSLEHNRLIDASSVENFSILLAFDTILSFVEFDESGSPKVIDGMETNQLLFYQTFVEHLNAVSNHFAADHILKQATIEVRNFNVNNNLRRNADLLFKFQIYLYAIFNEFRQRSQRTQILDQTLDTFSCGEKYDSQLCIDSQMNLLRFRIAQIILLPFKLNFNSNESQLGDLVACEKTGLFLLFFY